MQSPTIDIVQNSVQVFQAMTASDKRSLAEKFYKEMEAHGYKRESRVAQNIFMTQIQDIAKTQEDQEILLVTSLCVFV